MLPRAKLWTSRASRAALRNDSFHSAGELGSLLTFSLHVLTGGRNLACTFGPRSSTTQRCRTNLLHKSQIELTCTTYIYVRVCREFESPLASDHTYLRRGQLAIGGGQYVNVWKVTVARVRGVADLG